MRALIRPAQAADTPALQAIERDAARAFLALPSFAFCAALPARTQSEHERVRETGLSLILEQHGQPIGFALILPVDGHAHLLETAIARDHQGRGFGRQLIGAAQAEAIGAGYREMTLTTYRDVPWNAPFYARLGFIEILPDATRKGLNAIVQEEVEAGFARQKRVAMRKALV
jgi:GNAT superfamily N-acetyltransferase